MWLVRRKRHHRSGRAWPAPSRQHALESLLPQRALPTRAPVVPLAEALFEQLHERRKVIPPSVKTGQVGGQSIGVIRVTERLEALPDGVGGLVTGEPALAEPSSLDDFRLAARAEKDRVVSSWDHQPRYRDDTAFGGADLRTQGRLHDHQRQGRFPKTGILRNPEPLGFPDGHQAAPGNAVPAV